MMEEEVTRAISLASKSKDMAQLSLITALFGEGSEAEVRVALPEAKKYLDFVAERDSAKNAVASKLQKSAASPRAAHSPLSLKHKNSGKNADGTPFSKAQVQSMKRRAAARDGNLIPPQAATYIQLIWRGKAARKYMRRRHRSATAVCATFRGFLIRRDTAIERQRWHALLKDESMRSKRIKRIEAQRAELALLRRTPATRLTNVDNRRRNIAVRRIQKFFRTLEKRPWFRLKHGRKVRRAERAALCGTSVTPPLPILTPRFARRSTRSR